MKYIANLFRVFVGLLFIFSGVIKANDPTGFSYKLDEYFSVFSAELETAQDSIEIRVLTLDDSISYFAPISTTAENLVVDVSNTEWKAVPLPERIRDTVFFSEVNIAIGSASLLNAPINTSEGDSLLLSVQVNSYYNGKELTSDVYSFTRDSNIAENITIGTTDYIKPQSWLVGFFQSMRPYALALAIFLCVLEVVLGIALLIGWSPKLIVTLLILLILFFTFLTWYSAYYNKVTDCGCFGDAIKLTPWESFYKDVILCVSIFFITLGVKYIKPIFSKPFAVKLLTVLTILSVSFSVYCWNYLPVKNFLKFKKGNNIQELAVVPEDAPSDVYENVFIYAKDGVEEEFTLADMSGRNLKEEGYEFVDRRDKLISIGYEPEIHDFKIMDESRNNDYVDDFFANDTAFKILIVINEVQKANADAMTELRDIIKACKKEGIEIYPLTASSVEEVDAFRHEHQLDIPFYYGDKTNLKSIIRSNPGLVLFDGNIVKKNWPSTRLPSVERFLKKASK